MSGLLQALGPIKYAQAQVESYPKFLDQLAFAAAVKESECQSSGLDLELPLDDIFSCLDNVALSSENHDILADFEFLHDQSSKPGEHALHANPSLHAFLDGCHFIQNVHFRPCHHLCC